jgi:hypothetical protein
MREGSEDEAAGTADEEVEAMGEVGTKAGALGSRAMAEEEVEVEGVASAAAVVVGSGADMVMVEGEAGARRIEIWVKSEGSKWSFSISSGLHPINSGSLW